MIRVPKDEFTLSAHQDQLEVLSDFDKALSRFFLINWHRRARKSTLAINILIKECCKNPLRRYGYVTSTFAAAKNIIWRDPNMLKKWLPSGYVKKMNESELYVEFANGSVLSIHGSDKPDSIRGVDFHGLVMDEAPLCKKEVWEEILRPIIAQSPDRWAIFIFTPKGKASWIYNLWVKAKEDKDFARYRLDVTQSGIIPKEEIEKLRRELPARVFAQEFLCSFEESSASVFKNIEECVEGRLEPYERDRTYVTGVDLAKVDDWTVLTTICREDRHVVGFERFNQIDWNIQKERILAHCRAYNSLAVIDATGVGSPIVDDLRKAGLSLFPFQITSTTKKELIERLMVVIEQRYITFPDIETLIDELGSFAYEVSDHGNIKFSAPVGMHDDCVISLALAVQGMKSFIYGKKRIKRLSSNKKEDMLNGGISF